MAGPEVEQFMDEVPVKMAEPPWNYNVTLLAGKRVSILVIFLCVCFVLLLLFFVLLFSGGP